MVRFRSLIPAVLCLAVIIGCGPADNRVEVSGTVTLKGKPLPDGSVMFIAADPAVGSQASAAVSNGAYKFPKDGGLLPGKYKVAVTSPDGKTPDADPDAPPGPSGNFTSKDRVPAAYNTHSKLEFEVKAGQPNVFNIDIP